jgi:hypothetical protein
MQGYPRITIISVPSVPHRVHFAGLLWLKDFYFLLIRWRVSEIKRLHTEAKKKKARRENKTRHLGRTRVLRAESSAENKEGRGSVSGTPKTLWFC